MDKKINIMPIIIITIIVLLAGITAVYLYMNHNGNSYLAYKSKADQNKGLVYTAEYKSEMDKTSYVSEVTEEVYSPASILVPYININSQDVNEINTELKGLYEEFISIYSECFNTPWYIKSNYMTYVNKNILSVLIEKEMGGTYHPIKTFYTYNVNLEDLTRMTYDELCEYKGFSSEEIKRKLERKVLEYMNSLNENAWTTENEREDYIDASLLNYENSLEQNNLQFFVNEENILTDAIKIKTPGGIGEVIELIEIE